MTRRTRSFLALSLVPLTLTLAGFDRAGTVARRLESIKITPGSATSSNATFHATGKFNTAPEKVTPLPVSWYQMGPAIDPPGPGYSLVDKPFHAVRCNPTVANPVEFKYTVIAVAPANPKAPKSGPMPFKVFEDLVIQHTKTSEGGFVAATAKLSCP